MASKFKDANGSIPYGFLDTFGREFFKWEVLWKPQPNCNEFQIQPRTHIAYRTLAQTLNLSVEEILEILKTFPTACLDLMSRYETCNRLDEECRVPDWLRTLAPHFRLLNKPIIYRGGTTEYLFQHDASAETGRRDLVRALYDSARRWLGGGQAGGPAETGCQADVTEDEASPLQGPQAVAYFAQKHHLTEKQVAPAWRCVLKLCKVKQSALLAAGDRRQALPGALLAAAPERALADLALLHEPRMTQLALLTPAKLRTLVLLFQLIVAAKEIYNREERLQRRGAGDIDTGPGGGGGGPQVGLHARGGEHESATTATIRFSDEPPEITDSDRISVTSSAPNRFDSAIEELSIKYIEPCNSPKLLREKVVQWQSRRDTTVEGSSDNELHTELDLEPDTLIISSDTSDYETSVKYFEEHSENNIEDPILLEENRVEESNSNLIRNRERESDISSKSQNFDSKSQYPTKYWYEESKSNSSEEQRVVWALVYADFIKRGRSASLISLQHRWVELLHRARVALLTAWTSDTHADRNVHPLLLAVAYWFPEIVTESLPPWKRLVLERQIVLESDIKDIIHKYQENDSVLLNITENMPYPDLLKEYVNNKDINFPQGPSKINSTNKHLSYQMHKENPPSIIDNNIDKDLEQESQAQESAINNELKANNCISRMLDEIDPSKATVSITFDEDWDEDAKDDNSTDVRENKHDLNNLQVLKREGAATYSREAQHQTPSALDKCNKLTEITINIEKELQDKLKYMNNFRSDSFVSNTEFNKNSPDSNELHTDDQTVRYDFGTLDELNLLEPKSPEIDEKLVHLSRVVVTPIEHLPEWKKHSRNGVIRCRSFSVRNFTKPVIPKSNQLSKCTPYINTNKNTFHTKDYDKIKSEIDSEEYESENLRKNEVRIKFEDDDINNGIKYQKYIELYSMPDDLRKNRIKLTRKLKLSRTYFSLNFWCLDRNVQLMKLCKPVTIKVNKSVPRVAKRVELPDINEVRRINRSILTAQVSPTLDTTPPRAQRSSASQEAAISTNNSISSNSGTTRQTNNSISSALDSSELLKLLTDYAIKTKIPKENLIECATKDITSYSNLMDSILESMRRTDENNVQNSTITGTSNSLQQTDPSELLKESCSTNITTADTLNTIQKFTEKVQNNSKLNSINDSLTASNIHISSNSTKELYIKHVQKMNSISHREETRTPTVRELKDMILLLVKQFDTTIRHYYTMKIDRSSLNLHMKKFDRQRLALVKTISKLTKILPKYDLIEEDRSDTKNASATTKGQKSNWSKCKESKERAAPLSGDRGTIVHLASNTNSVCADDDCEPNLVIDESSLQLTDNTELNNSQFNKIHMKNNTQETCGIKKKDKKKKILTKAKKKSNPSNKISEEDKPMLNEYQEWQRQKTMALKYFTIPMSDTSKLTSKDKIAQQQTTTRPTEQQSNDCQTNISIKRKNSEEVATTSAEQQSNGCQTNISILRKNIEEVATTSAEQQSNDCQTNISIKIINTEEFATTLAKEQSNKGCRTNLPIKRKKTKDFLTTSAKQQSNGCQTNISINRKNTKDFLTTTTASDITRHSKFNPDESNVVYISDTSSDDDIEITECSFAKDTATGKTNENNHQIDKTEKGNKILNYNDSSQNQATNQNVCVINTPVAAINQPVYLIINDTQMPTATQDAINKTQDAEKINNPLVFQVHSSATPFPTLTQIVPQNQIEQTQVVVNNENSKRLVQGSYTFQCQRAFNSNCRCIRCNTALTDDVLTNTLNAIQTLTSQDLTNNMPSTSLLKQNHRPIKEAITVEEYLSSNKKLTALIKVDGSQNLLFFCNKFIILTDVNIPSNNPTYRTTIRTKRYKALSEVLVPSDRRGSVLLLGPKKESDYIYCKCVKGAGVSCNLCDRIVMNLPNPTNFLKIGSDYYKKMSEKPIKYVRLSENELVTNSRVVLEGNPHLILVSHMFFKKLTDTPPTYVRILSSVKDTATLRNLIRKQVLLYAFDVTQTQHYHTPLTYAQTAGHVTFDHSDDNLVKVLQWLLN